MSVTSQQPVGASVSATVVATIAETIAPCIVRVTKTRDQNVGRPTQRAVDQQDPVA